MNYFWVCSQIKRQIRQICFSTSRRLFFLTMKTFSNRLRRILYMYYCKCKCPTVHVRVCVRVQHSLICKNINILRQSQSTVLLTTYKNFSHIMFICMTKRFQSVESKLKKKRELSYNKRLIICCNSIKLSDRNNA